MTAGVALRRLADDGALRGHAHYQDAVALCRKYAALYAAMIKLAPDRLTDQKVILHVASASAGSDLDPGLRDLDLITDISLTAGAGGGGDDVSSVGGESGGAGSEASGGGRELAELTEFRARESHTHV